MIFNLKMFDVNKKIIVNESEGYESVLKHSHDFIEITYIKSGIALHQINNNHYEIKKGDVFVIETDAVHSIKPISKKDDFSIINVLIDKSYFPNGINIKPNLILNLKTLDYEKQINRIKEEFFKVDSNEEVLFLLVQNLINSFKVEMLLADSDTVNNNKKKMASDEHINLAIKYIKAHYNEKIDVDDIANAIGLYPGYLQKLFRKKHSTSIMKYLQHYRVERSCQYLIETNLSIEQIVMLVGINDVKNYYTYFKRYFNTTPKKFRIEHMKLMNTNNSN